VEYDWVAKSALHYWCKLLASLAVGSMQ